MDQDYSTMTPEELEKTQERLNEAFKAKRIAPPTVGGMPEIMLAFAEGNDCRFNLTSQNNPKSAQITLAGERLIEMSRDGLKNNLFNVALGTGLGTGQNAKISIQFRFLNATSFCHDLKVEGQASAAHYLEAGEELTTIGRMMRAARLQEQLVAKKP